MLVYGQHTRGLFTQTLCLVRLTLNCSNLSLSIWVRIFFRRKKHKISREFFVIIRLCVCVCVCVCVLCLCCIYAYACVWVCVYVCICVFSLSLSVSLSLERQAPVGSTVPNRKTQNFKLRNWIFWRGSIDNLIDILSKPLIVLGWTLQVKWVR